MSQQRDLVHGDLDQVSESLAIQALNDRWILADKADFGSDVDVLNYALTLEYLEAAFYEQGNAAQLLSGTAKTYLDKIQSDEEYHVTAITQTITKLGGTPVAKPMVNFGKVFASKESYLTNSYTFENLGVMAYLGAAGYIKDKTILQAAAGIFGVEARHAAIVGNLLGKSAENGVYMGAFEKPATKATVLAKATPFIVSQMKQMPGGAPQTGGGSTAGTQDTTLLKTGAAAVAGGVGLAGYLAAQRKRPQPAPATATPAPAARPHPSASHPSPLPRGTRQGD